MKIIYQGESLTLQPVWCTLIIAIALFGVGMLLAYDYRCRGHEPKLWFPVALGVIASVLGITQDWYMAVKGIAFDAFGPSPIGAYALGYPIIYAVMIVVFVVLYYLSGVFGAFTYNALFNKD